MACSLLPGAFGVFVQGLLFLISVSVLVYKKKLEERNLRVEARSWPTFMLDSSKQLVGAGWVHCLNMLCASVLGVHMEGNGCEWYWVNIMVDTTLGVGIEYVLLWALTEAFESATMDQGTYRSGEYKDSSSGKINLSKFLSQLMVWLLCVTFMKFGVLILMLSFHSQFEQVAHGFLGAFPQSSEVQLVVVMLITPCVMNAFQFWLTDNFIKGQSGSKFGGHSLYDGEGDGEEVPELT
mmetsp:Transcript_32600/g.96834  ORF Transcript_32600/g.96834 Transcript_32600/m.96834 type:complete len:237 (-) Transcript_32600:35-745(-)